MVASEGIFLSNTDMSERLPYFNVSIIGFFLRQHYFSFVFNPFCSVTLIDKRFVEQSPINIMLKNDVRPLRNTEMRIDTGIFVVYHYRLTYVDDVIITSLNA